MPNPYFRFKQFAIYQDQCAMKVCTDACIFGAYTVSSALYTPPKLALDIGSGTGLLTLMLAQQLPNTSFDAVEIDDAAYRQCTENIANSIWKDRISIHHHSIQSFVATTDRTYDLIVSNPPFYPEHLQPSDLKKRKAMHTTQLTFHDLLQSIQYLLAPHGYAMILLPPTQSTQLEQLASTMQLYPHSRLFIHDKVQAPAIRTIVKYSRQLMEKPPNHRLCIKNNDGSYSAYFTALLKEYYLAL